MNPILSVLPAIIAFLAGLIMRRSGAVSQSFGNDILKLVFYVTAPLLIFNSLVAQELSFKLLAFPVTVSLLIFGGCASALIYLWLAKPGFDRSRIGSIVVGSSIVNTGFVLSFAQSAFGYEGVSRIAAADIAAGTITFTFVFMLAAHYGSATKGKKKMMLKPLAAPPIYAVILALILNINNIAVPEELTRIFDFVGQPTGMLSIFAVGSLVNIKIQNFRQYLLPIGIKAAVGLVIAVTVISLFDLQAIDRALITALCLSPLGFNAANFASIEKLDIEYTANAISISFILGVIMVPLAIILWT